MVAGLPIAQTKAASPALLFEENKTQWDPAVRYHAAVPGGEVWLRSTGFTYTWINAADRARYAAAQAGSARPWEGAAGPAQPLPAPQLRAHAVQVDFEGANATGAVAGQRPVEAYGNYFMGNNPSRWASHVRSYPEVRYQALYPGTDLRVYGTAAGQFEYDLTLAPGADPGRLRLRYRGATSLRVLPGGALAVGTSVGEVREQRPVAYQLAPDGRRQPVPCRYRLAGTTVRFELPAGYDRTRSLVIDPVVQAATYVGITNRTEDFIPRATTYDGQGNLYVGGVAVSGGYYPTTPGAFVIALGVNTITKLNPTGTARLYSTHFGGTQPLITLEELGHLTCDAAGNLFVCGYTAATNFPMLANSYDPVVNNGDVFICKLSPAGDALLASTYLGGSGAETTLQCGGLRVDASGAVYVAGNTTMGSVATNNFPTTAGAYIRTVPASASRRGFIAHLDPQLTTLRWATFLESTNFNSDAGTLRVSPTTGLVYYLGNTADQGHAVGAGAAHSAYSVGYVGCLAADGSRRVAATYLPTMPSIIRPLVYPKTMDLDAAGNVCVGGKAVSVVRTAGSYVAPSASTFVPGADNYFVTKLNAGLSRIEHTAILGGGDLAGTQSICLGVDQCGNITVASSLVSLPAAGNLLPILNPLPGGGNPAGLHVATLSSDFRQLLFASYYGNSMAAGRPWLGTTSAVDPQGRVYTSVLTFNFLGINYPTLPTAYQPVPLPGAVLASADGVGVIIDPQFVTTPAPRAAFTAATSCASLAAQLQSTSTNVGAFRWDFGDGSPLDSVTAAPQHLYAAPGTYRVRLRVRPVAGACGRPDTTSRLVVLGGAPPRALLQQASLCAGTALVLDAGNPGNTYRWSTGATTQTIQVTAPGRYIVQTGVGVCARIDTAVVVGLPAPARVLPAQAVLCPGETLVLDAGNPGSTYRWNTGATTQTIGVTTAGTYSVVIRNPCGRTDTVRVGVNPAPTLARDSVACGDVTLRVVGAAAGSTYRWSTGATTPALAVDQPGRYTVSVTGPTCQFELQAYAAPARPDLLVPNIFTPNPEDALNATFAIPGLPAGTRLSVFNRWGSLVYQASNYQNDWAAPGLPDGVYYYLLENEKFCRASQLKGWVEVRR